MLDVIISSILIIVMCIAAYALRMLSLSGALSAIPIGLVTMLAGPEWFVIILYFLLIGSLTTKYKRKLKHEAMMVHEKGGARKWINIVSNGFWPSIAAFTSLFFNSTYLGFLYMFYVGSISSMAADTAATELGLLSRTPPRLITNIRRIVVRGTSGGITLFGLVSSLVVSASVGLIAIPGATLISIEMPRMVAIAAVSGFIGSLIDSAIGATIQGIYKCKVCGMISENKFHCGENGDLMKGIGIINNHMVNFLSSLFGGIIAIIIYGIYV